MSKRPKSCLIATLLLVLGTSGLNAQQASTVDADGAVHPPAPAVPLSPLSSTEAKKFFLDYFVHGSRSLCGSDGEARDINAVRQKLDDCLRPGIARLRTVFAVDIRAERIAGVPTDVIAPTGGIAAKNKRRVLINLHGGGFMVGGGLGGQMESIPIAALGAIKVVSIDYREAPEHKFPAGSEDVTAVYRALLKSYPARNIGIYGCSAGGVLTAESVAWFQTHDLPGPGAIGLFGSGALIPIVGDSNYTGAILTAGRGPIFATWGSPMAETDAKKVLPYFDVPELNIRDPLVSPAYFPSVLAKFPPSLIISGTRDFELSPAVYTHSQMVKQGVDTDLHVWEGATHCAFGQPVADPSVPETREAWDVTVKFFDKHLGK